MTDEPKDAVTDATENDEPPDPERAAEEPEPEFKGPVWLRMKRVGRVAFLPRNPTDEDIQRFVDFFKQPIRKPPGDDVREDAQREQPDADHDN